MSDTFDMTTRVIYRDALMLVLNKPAGLPVHPGPKGGFTLMHHLDSLRFGLPSRPQAAHRLDRDTSGCLVLGRHAKALARLNALFREGRIEKTYLALVEGEPDDEGLIDLAMSPRSPVRGWWMKVGPLGQEARTQWRVLKRVEGLSLLELKPLTGRTHQLRVHCAAKGWPILGDAVYGHADRFKGPDLHLHAATIRIPLYEKREPVTVEAPPPDWLKNCLDDVSFASAAPA